MLDCDWQSGQTPEQVLSTTCQYRDGARDGILIREKYTNCCSLTLQSRFKWHISQHLCVGSLSRTAVESTGPTVLSPPQLNKSKSSQLECGVECGVEWWECLKVLVLCVSVLVPAQHYEMMVWYSSDSLLPALSCQLPAASSGWEAATVTAVSY